MKSFRTKSAGSTKPVWLKFDYISVWIKNCAVVCLLMNYVNSWQRRSGVVGLSDGRGVMAALKPQSILTALLINSSSLARLCPSLKGGRLIGRLPLSSISSPQEYLSDELREVFLPGEATKRLTGNGEKLTYSPAAGCNWLCLAGVYFPSFYRGYLSDGPCRVVSHSQPIWV